MKVKNCLLLFLFNIFCSGSFSQTKTIEYKFARTPSNLMVYPSFNEENNSYTFTFLQRDSITKILIQGNTIVSQFSKSRFKEKRKSSDAADLLAATVVDTYKGKFIGGNLNRDLQEEYYQLSDTSIVTVSTDFRTKKTIISDTVSLGENEHCATAFSQGNSFYFVYYINNTIKIYKKELGVPSSCIERTLALNKNDLSGNSGEAVTKKLEKFSDFFDYPYSVIQNGKEYSLAVTQLHNKIYILPGKLIFTLDNQFHRTVAIEINLDDSYYTIMKYDQPGIIPHKHIKEMYSCTNSFIVDSLIIQANIINNNFNLAVSNRKSGSIYKTYSVKKGETPNFLNGDILRTETIGSKSYTIVSNFQKVIEKAEITKLALTATNNNSILKITIGAPNMPTVSLSVGQVLLSLAFTAIGTYGINSLPNTSGFNLFLFDHKTSDNNISLTENCISFQSLFNNQDFGHINGNAEINENANILQQFIHQNKIEEGNSFLTQSNGIYHLGYYDKKENSYVVYTF
jgi:hypothetical protein